MPSRAAQEFIADEVAARAAGAAVMASALRKVHGAAVAFHDYWSGEVSPVLNSGYLPPLAAGFARFVQVESVSVERRDRDPDGGSRRGVGPVRHAPAAARARRRAEVAAAGQSGDTRPAVSLLGDPQRWERRLLAAAINEEWARSLKPVAWDKVVDTVYVPMWRQGVKENARIVSPASR